VSRSSAGSPAGSPDGTDHQDARRLEVVLGDHLLACVLGVDDDRIHAPERVGRDRRAPAAALERVVDRQHRRPVRQQPQIQARNGQPLEVHDVGVAGSRAAVAQHVRHVLGALAERSRPRARRTERMPVELLVPHVTVRVGRVPVGEGACDQPHQDAESRERAGERGVVGR
jgi:hypothetical protein